MCALTVLEAASLKSVCWQNHLLSACSREDASLPLPGFSWTSAILGVPCFVAASPQTVCVVSWMSSPCLPSSLHGVLLSHKNTSQSRATLRASFQLDYVCKDLGSKSGHILRHWGLGLYNIFLRYITELIIPFNNQKSNSNNLILFWYPSYFSFSLINLSFMSP